MNPDIKYQAVKRLSKECITLRLLQQGEGLIVERESVQADGSSQTQALPIFCLAGARFFMEADPYYLDLKQAYGQIYERVQRHFQARES